MVKNSLLFLLAISSSAVASQDPTAPLSWQQAPKVNKVVRHKVPDLQSIVCGGERDCYAILNGQTLEAGGNVAGFKVQQINADYVTVTRGSKQWKLELFPLEIKQ
ncbi:MSHA biogenesis protein MshK [Vibrio ponticus]|uniref:MSHA biogenesis protein MshK n=1 Tax=Vibrio rhodolitus TaxID=2231649 RepID=UPI000502AEBC|nr:MSHA biogenesis protein MshK [Vibrio rhodolitus]GAK83432.1 MSHA biogenesis protein MshK [Vibrio ponticus]